MEKLKALGRDLLEALIPIFIIWVIGIGGLLAWAFFYGASR